MNIITIKYLQNHTNSISYLQYLYNFIFKKTWSILHINTFIMTNLIIQFYDKTIGVVRICNLTNMGLKAICLGYNVRVNAQFQVMQHIAFSLASCDAF